MPWLRRINTYSVCSTAVFWSLVEFSRSPAFSFHFHVYFGLHRTCTPVLASSEKCRHMAVLEETHVATWVLLSSQSMHPRATLFQLPYAAVSTYLSLCSTVLRAPPSAPTLFPVPPSCGPSFLTWSSQPACVWIIIHAHTQARCTSSCVQLIEPSSIHLIHTCTHIQNIIMCCKAHACTLSHNDIIIL